MADYIGSHMKIIDESGQYEGVLVAVDVVGGRFSLKEGCYLLSKYLNSLE